MVVRDYRDLTVWQRAMTLAEKCYETLNTQFRAGETCIDLLCPIPSTRFPLPFAHLL